MGSEGEGRYEEEEEEDQDEESEDFEGDVGTLSIYSQLITRCYHDSLATRSKSILSGRLHPREFES